MAHRNTGRGGEYQVRGAQDQPPSLRRSGSTPPLARTPFGSLLAAEQPLSTIWLLARWTWRFPCQLYLSLSCAEYKMSLRIRLLRSPASLDVGDAEGGILCRCNKRVDLHSDPLHFFHCRSSQGQFIRRHDHIRDALHDMISVAVRDDTPYTSRTSPASTVLK